MANKRVSLLKVAEYIWKHYGGCTISRLYTRNNKIIPKCYVAWYTSPIIFTRDKKKSENLGYVYIEPQFGIDLACNVSVIFKNCLTLKNEYLCV